MSHSAALWLSLLLLLGNAFFVGAEFAVMAARRSQLEPMAAAGSKRAQVSLEALEQVASLLACAQLGITLCSVGLGAVAEAALHEMLIPVLHGAGLSEALAHPIALALALLVVAYLHVVIGEMVPKNLAIAGPDKAALALAPPLLYITRALRPRDPADGGRRQGAGPRARHRAQGRARLRVHRAGGPAHRGREPPRGAARGRPARPRDRRPGVQRPGGR